MTSMKRLLISACLLALSDSTYRYNVNDYLDDAVEEFNMKVLRAGDEAIVFDDPLVIGGFVLTRPKLADMSSLERAGDAWLEPLPNGVVFSAYFKFGKMYLDGWNLTGPGKNADKPRISARDNIVKVTFKGNIDTTSSWSTDDGGRVITKNCFATYQASLTDVTNVALVTSDGATSLVTWTQGLLPQISEQLNPYLIAVFEKHFDLCKILKNNGYKWSTN